MAHHGAGRKREGKLRYLDKEWLSSVLDRGKVQPPPRARSALLFVSRALCALLVLDRTCLPFFFVLRSKHNTQYIHGALKLKITLSTLEKQPPFYLTSNSYPCTSRSLLPITCMLWLVNSLIWAESDPSICIIKFIYL